MLGHQFAHSAAPLRKVKEVQFGILSPEEIVSFRARWAFLPFFKTFFWNIVRKRTPSRKLSTQR